MSYNILCIDDDLEFLTSQKALLLTRYNNVQTSRTLDDGLNIINECDIDVVLLDIKLSKGENGLDGLKQIKQLANETDVIMVTGFRDPKTIVTAIHAGATDYLCKPFDPDELFAVIDKNRSIRELKDRHNALIEDINTIDKKSRILGSSESILRLLRDAKYLKGHMNANVLILGESGTGKELLARYIHLAEKDSKRPFVAVNCAAIPDSLIESELFGYERGAFTGANRRKIGKFELANGGDIFLDEISSLRLDLQAKILRVIQEKEIVRIGGNTAIPINFRVISATNDNLTKLVDEGKFRLDLYHRIRVVEFTMPPLRERKKDIPMLVNYFLSKDNVTEYPKKITRAALQKLEEYSWPGNVRELENVILSLSILSHSDIIEEKHLPEWLKDSVSEDFTVSKGQSLSLENSIKFTDFLKKAELMYIRMCLNKHNGDKTRTAEALEMSRSNLYIKLRELGLSH